MDLSLVENLLSEYRRKFREEHYCGIWRDIFDQHQRSLHEVFMEGSAEEARAVLGNPLSNHLHYGFENTFKGCIGENSNDVSLLRRLSEALGAERVENPEHNSMQMSARKLWRRLDSAESILQRIDGILGRVDFPNPFPGETGIVTSRGMASFRAIQAIYQASLLKGRVLEIGGGLGRTAYYAQRFGIADYTIVDLPFSGISQGYFLGRVLPTNTISLQSPDEFFDRADTYDMVLNVDSITELSAEMARKYAEAIRRRSGRLISINHESNRFTVRDLFGKSQSRHPYWFRTGYVEELFTF
jgi:hypothetical protein